MSDIFVKRLWLGLVNIIYPLRCVNCARPIPPYSGAALCPNCLESLRPNSPPMLPMRHGSSFDAAYAAYFYEGVARKCIHQFKYRDKPWLGKFLGRLLAEFIRGHIKLEDIDIILAVPLHKKRLRSRTYNQAELLASVVARELQKPLSKRNFQRIKDTPSLVSLSRHERLKNVSDAFDVKAPLEWRGKSLLLIDDVFTTGATTNECAKALRACRPARINICTFARDV